VGAGSYNSPSLAVVQAAGKASHPSYRPQTAVKYGGYRPF
jgi:hypothetical protein